MCDWLQKMKIPRLGGEFNGRQGASSPLPNCIHSHTSSNHTHTHTHINTGPLLINVGFQETIAALMFPAIM